MCSGSSRPSSRACSTELDRRAREICSAEPDQGLITYLVCRASTPLTPVAGSGRYQAIFMIDLDGFKAINDKFGHDVGDQVLIAVAERLQKGLRHGDTAARLGGDEFVVLADNLSGPTTAVAIGERILEALSTPIELAVGALVPGASIGIAVSSESSVSAEVLLREADSALYEAKRTGRGRAVLSSPQYVLQ